MEDIPGHLGLAAVAFLAATVLPGSSEALLAAMVIRQPDETASLLAAATAGNTAGAAVNWCIGRWLVHLVGRRWFPVSRAWLDHASTWFSRYGAWLLLFTWVPVVGDPLTVAGGALKVRLVPFLVLVATGKAARYAAVVGGVGAVRSWL